MIVPINREEVSYSFFISLILDKLSNSSILKDWQIQEYFSSFIFILNQVEKTNHIEKDFYSGLSCIHKKIDRTKALYLDILDNVEDYGVESISGTLKSFPSFFESYDNIYGAHLTPGVWIDYQLSEPVDDKKIMGIDFIYTYLIYLKAELDFLSCLPKRVVVNTLETYSEKLGFDYKIDVNNIYDIMFNQWIVISFLKKDSQFQDTLEITDKEASFLLSQMEHFQIFCLSANPFIKHEYYKKTVIRLYDRVNRCDSLKQLSHILMIRTKYAQMSYLNILDGNKYQEEAHGIYDLYLNHSLDRKVWMKKMEKLSFSVVILLILFYRRDNKIEWNSWNDMVNDNIEDEFLEVLKSKVKGCSLEEMNQMNDVLHQIKLPMIDFY